MQKTDRNPSTWLDALPEPERTQMQRLDQLIAAAMQGHSRALWEGKFWAGTEQSIIGYGDLDFTGARNKVVPWFMVGLALQKNYFSVYVNAVDGGKYLAETWAGRLGKVKGGKASLSFKHIDDIDLDILKKIVDLARQQLDARAS